MFILNAMNIWNESCMFYLHIFLLGSKDSGQNILATKCTKRKYVKKISQAASKASLRDSKTEFKGGEKSLIYANLLDWILQSSQNVGQCPILF